MSEVNMDKLLHDLRQVVHDAEELLRVTAGQAGEKIAEARARAEASLRTAREQMAAISSSAVAKGREAAEQTDAFVRHNPWTAVGIGAAIGLLVGLLLARRGGGTE